MMKRILRYLTYKKRNSKGRRPAQIYLAKQDKEWRQ
jgi:hypothetical protein